MSIEPIIAENKEQIDYNPIYKVNQIVDGVINAVYVFYGQPIVKKNEKEIIKKIFEGDPQAFELFTNFGHLNASVTEVSASLTSDGNPPDFKRCSAFSTAAWARFTSMSSAFSAISAITVTFVGVTSA